MGNSWPLAKLQATLLIAPGLWRRSPTRPWRAWPSRPANRRQERTISVRLAATIRRKELAAACLAARLNQAAANSVHAAGQRTPSG